MRRVLLAAPLLLIVLAAPAARSEKADPPKPKATEVDRAIERGVQYLLDHQNKNGSWGSPANNLYLDLYAPIPGSQQTFAVASSALALAALIEVGGDSERVQKAIRRATDWLLKNHGVKRVSLDTIYNTWAYSYSLATWARLLAREKDPARRKLLKKAAQKDVAFLKRFEFVEGGWGYYNFSFAGKDPGQGSTSFTSATALVALKMVAEQGVKVPTKMVDKACKLVRRCERPDGAFAYSYSTSWWGTAGINKTKGSLARTPTCILALGWWGREMDPRRYAQALEELEKYGHFLRIARKYPYPHETWYQNSGYFCFYGYYYASLLLPLVSERTRDKHRKLIAGHLMKMQEKDGSWFDYQLHKYHKAYGTGYVLLALGACRNPDGIPTARKARKKS